MRQGNVFPICYRVEQGIAHIAMPNLPPFDFGNIKRLFTIRAHEAKINCWRCLQFYFKKLVADVRELSVILKIAVSKALADKPV